MSEEPKKYVEIEQFGLKIRIPIERDEEPKTQALPTVVDAHVQQQQPYHNHQQQPSPPPAATMCEPSQRSSQSAYRGTGNSATDGSSTERPTPTPTSSSLNHRVPTVVASNLSDLPPPHVASREPLEFSVENEFSEMVSEPINPTMKPLVVLDCANLGWMYGGGKGFEPTGIEIALAFFSSFPAITVVAFIPAHYLKKKPRDGTAGKYKCNGFTMTPIVTSPNLM